MNFIKYLFIYVYVKIKECSDLFSERWQASLDWCFLASLTINTGSSLEVPLIPREIIRSVGKQAAGSDCTSLSG